MPTDAADGAVSNAAGAPVDTTQLDKFAEKALTATKNGRSMLAAAFYKRAVDEALRLHGDTFVGTSLAVRRAASLTVQAHLEGVSPDEKSALHAEAWTLVSSCLPLIVRRVDANTMLPGRGTAVELAFFKRFTAMEGAVFNSPPWPARCMQLAGLSFGYATAVLAADVLLGLLCVRRDSEAQVLAAYVLICLRRDLFCEWWTACCQPLEAWTNLCLEKRSLLHPIFRKYFLVPILRLTQRLSP